jgi:predicted transcriptional regulator
MVKKALLDGSVSFLSPLEDSALAVLWRLQSARTCDVHRELKRRHKRTTKSSVAVILDRLYKNGMLERRMSVGRGGIHYIYGIKANKSQFERTIVGSVVDRLIDTFGSNAVSYFNERFSKK